MAKFMTVEMFEEWRQEQLNIVVADNGYFEAPYFPLLSPPQQVLPRPRNHIGFSPKRIVPKYVHGAYVPPKQSILQRLGIIPSTDKLRSFEGMVNGRLEITE